MAIAAWRTSNREIFLLNFKGAYGGTQTLTICRYLPISLRFHSLSSRARAMVVTRSTEAPGTCGSPPIG
jgi:hypothetical protein